MTFTTLTTGKRTVTVLEDGVAVGSAGLTHNDTQVTVMLPGHRFHETINAASFTTALADAERVIAARLRDAAAGKTTRDHQVELLTFLGRDDLVALVLAQTEAQRGPVDRLAA